jgi:hypothetical protein
MEEYFSFLSQQLVEHRAGTHLVVAQARDVASYVSRRRFITGARTSRSEQWFTKVDSQQAEGGTDCAHFGAGAMLGVFQQSGLWQVICALL